MDYLSISSYHYDGWPVVEASGELDIATREELRERLYEIIGTHRPANVIVNLSCLEFCDAAGLGALVAARREARRKSGELRLVSRKQPFGRLLAITGLNGTMPLYDSLAQAVRDPWTTIENLSGGDSSMPVTHTLEKVVFTCGHCWHTWTLDYDVHRTRESDGHVTERYARDDVEVPSPYVPEGAPACPECGRHWLGRLAAQLPDQRERASGVADSARRA